MTDAEGNEIGKLFVGGLSQATNNGSLRLHFSRFGEVDDAVVMMDNKTGRSRGFGYVKYRTSDSVVLALEAKPHVLDGKEVDAKQCNVNMKGRNRRSLKIFVGGIGLDQDAESIKAYFKQFGRVTDVNLMMDSNKQRHRGFAFVGFEEESVVKRLIGLHYVTMNNKQVEIKAMEPPNFGRKASSNSCLSAASLMASVASVEGPCIASFDHLSDPNSILPSGFNNVPNFADFATHHAFLSTQVPSMHCPQHNFLGQTRASQANMYDQQHHPGFANTLPSDSMFQTTASFVQPGSVNPVARAAGDGFGPPSNSAASINLVSGQYSTPKQSIPLVISNNQLNQASNLGTSNMIGFPSGTPPVYATYPCHIMSPYLSPGANAQMINTDKASWPSGTSQLTVCPAQMPLQGGLATYPALQPVSAVSHGSGIPVQLVNQFGHGTSTLSPASCYSLYSPYSTIPMQSDQTGTIQYTTLSHSQNQCNIPIHQPGSGDAALNPVTVNSDSASPTVESKSESVGNKLSYPTLMFSPPHGSSLGNLPSNVTGSVGQTLWNHSTGGMVIPAFQYGWGIQQPNQTNLLQQWNPSTTVVTQPNSSVTGMADIHTIKTGVANGHNLNKLTQVTHEQHSTTKEVAEDSKNVPQIRASGDSLEGGVAKVDTNPNFCNSVYNFQNNLGLDAHFQVHKSTTDATPNFQDQQKPFNRMTELQAWQSVSTNSHINNAVALPPWTLMTGSAQLTPHWSELQQQSITGATCAASVPLMHPHSWNVSLGLVDESLAYENVANNSMQPGGSNIGNRRCLVQFNSEANKAISHGSTIPCSNLYGRLQSGIVHQQPTAQEPDGDRSLASPESQNSAGVGITTNLVSTKENTAETVSVCNNSTSTNGLNGNNDLDISASMRAQNGQKERSQCTDYAKWIYPSPCLTVNSENISITANKDVAHNEALGVDLECQCPAGAAGDFQHTLHPSSHFTNYPVRHH